MVPPATPRSLEGQWYRLALWLCPPVFRREHGDEMLRDFDDARGEAVVNGNGALWTLRFAIALDLVRTFGAQWLRTGLPAIALVSASLQLVVAEGLAKIFHTVRVPMPDNLPDEDVLGVLLIAITVVVLIGMTITLNLWVSRMNRRRLRRR